MNYVFVQTKKKKKENIFFPCMMFTMYFSMNFLFNYFWQERGCFVQQDTFHRGIFVRYSCLHLIHWNERTSNNSSWGKRNRNAKVSWHDDTRKLINYDHTFIRSYFNDWRGYCRFCSIKLIDRRSISMRIDNEETKIYLFWSAKKMNQWVDSSWCQNVKEEKKEWSDSGYCAKKINIDIILKVKTKIPKKIFG